MFKPWARQSPDTRIRHIKSARERETERAARLEEDAAKKFDGIRQAIGREQQRANTLHENDVKRLLGTSQAMEEQRQREAALQTRREGMEQFREVEARQQPLRRGVPTATPTPARETAPLPLIQPGYTPGGVRERLLPGLAAEPGPDPIGRGLRAAWESPMINPLFAEPAGGGPPMAEQFQTRYGDPTSAFMLQVAETRARGARGLPPEKPEHGVVNPIPAMLGDEEEQQKARQVLEDAGVVKGMAARIVFDPLNFVPIVGFTKVDDFVRLLKLASRAQGTARANIMSSPAVKNTIAAIRRGGADRVPPVGPEDVTRVTPEQLLEDPHVARADPGPPPSREPTLPGEPPREPPRGPSPDDPEFRSIQEVALKGEHPDATLMRRHDGAVNTQRTLARIAVEDGNALLHEAGMGQRYKSTIVPRAGQTDEFDELYRYLHNSSKVDSGELVVPERMRPAYDHVRAQTDFEQAARVDFDPDMALVQDYMYRGWKPPEGMFTGTGVRGPLGRKPGFKMPRVNATYDEMRAAGFEPLFWNPMEQARFSRMMGVKYREQMTLIEDLKKLEMARLHEGGPIPDGWRVPEVGPAFEGKPYASGDEVMYTRRIVVPDSLANRLENAYGKPFKMQPVTAFGKAVDPMKVIDALVFIPKRAKLVASVFQHVDFLGRSLYMGAWGGFVDALSHGQPIAAVGHLAKWPKTALEMGLATVSPGYQQKLRRLAVDTTPLFKERPGLSMRSISEANLSLRDPTLHIDIDKIAREVAAESKVSRAAKAPFRAAAEFERVHRKGLFQGIYPSAVLTDVKNNIAPMFARANPVRKGMTDAQLAGEIAKFANTRYSVIPASMSVVQNRLVRGFLTRFLFSLGENEGLIRLFTGALWGPNTSHYRKNWLGAYLGLITTANAIHFASTGEPLPWGRWAPISKDRWGPLPVGYNRDFAAPNIPLTGRSGAEVTMDLVGQLDTAFRLLDPASFLEARTSVPVGAGRSQIRGKDFFGAPIDTIGPEGVVSRTAQLIQDMLAPIGFGQAGLEILRDKISAAEGLIQPGEDRLGTAGIGVQATGVNLRAETTPQILDRIRGDVMREMGIEGRYEDLDQITKPDVDAKVEERIGPELEMRRETAGLRGQVTPESQFYTATDVKRGEQEETQLAADAKLNSNQWAGDVWRDDFADRQRESYIRRDELKNLYKIEFEDHPAKNKIDKAINDYFDVNLDDYAQPDGTKDWDGFFSAQDATLAPLSPADRKAVMDKVVHKYDTPTVREFREAQEVVDKFHETPKYVGLTVEQGKEVDRVLYDMAPALQTRFEAETGEKLSRREAVRHLSATIRDKKAREFLLEHFGGGVGGGLRRITDVRRETDDIRNEKRDQILIDNERLLVRFYNDLLERELSREQAAGLLPTTLEALFGPSMALPDVERRGLRLITAAR